MEQLVYNIYALSIFIIGTLFGSFFSLATYRIPRKQDILITRSYCPKCKHKLGFFDCFPILSYISTIGKCKYCHEPISPRYILLELVNGLVFLVFFFVFGISASLAVICLCYAVAFVCIGSLVMEKNMTAEEKEQVEKKNIIQKKKTSSGAINVDILIAAIVFLVYIVATIYTTRLYSRSMVESVRDIDATSICTNLLALEKAKPYNGIFSRSGVETVDNYDYEYVINVYPYLKDDYIEIDGYKVIEVTTTYYVDGNKYERSLKTIKMEVVNE